MPKVLVIILNWDGFKDTVECLISLYKNTYPNFKILIIDNGSKGNDVQLLERKFGEKIEIIKNKRNLGFASGNNQGIKYAIKKKLKYVILLNNDAVVDPSFISELVNVAETNKNTFAVGVKVIDYYNRERVVDAAGDISKFRIIYSNSYPSEVAECDFVGGCACMLNVKILEKNKLFFDKDFFAYHDDIELFDRARGKGFRVLYNPRAIIYHKVSASSKGKKRSAFFLYYDFRNRLLFVSKRRNIFNKVIFFLYFFLYEFPKDIFRSLIIYRNFSEPFVFIKALIDFLFHKWGDQKSFSVLDYFKD